MKIENRGKSEGAGHNSMQRIDYRYGCGADPLLPLIVAGGMPLKGRANVHPTRVHLARQTGYSLSLFQHYRIFSDRFATAAGLSMVCKNRRKSEQQLPIFRLHAPEGLPETKNEFPVFGSLRWQAGVESGGCRLAFHLIENGVNR